MRKHFLFLHIILILKISVIAQTSYSHIEFGLRKMEAKGEIQWRGNVIIFLTYTKSEIPFWKEMTQPMMEYVNKSPYSFAMLPKELRKKDGSYNVKDLVVLNDNGHKAISDMLADEKFYTTGKFILRIEWAYRYLFSEFENGVHSLRNLSLQPYYNDTLHQFWKFKSANNGYYKIVNGIGKCLQWLGDGSDNDATLITSADANGDAQLWKIVSTANDNYFLMSKNGRFLTLSKGGVGENDLTKFNVFASLSKEENENYRWQLIKVQGNEEVLTTYKPEVNGFRFANLFKGHDFISWSGQCGGMSYASLDYYFNKKSTPKQSWIPFNTHPLQAHIWHRQVNSLGDMDDKIAEIGLDALNTRRGEFFWWGTQGFGGGRLQEIKEVVGMQNRPVPLLLHKGEEGDIFGDHVVVCYGYAMGRYTGNHKGHQQDYQMYIYNPNNGNSKRTIVPNIAGQCYFELESGLRWNTYSVNRNYAPSGAEPVVAETPEAETDGNIKNLYAVFKIGGDDLREGSQITLTIVFKDNSKQEFKDVNKFKVWHGDTYQGVHLSLNKAIKKADIKEFILSCYSSNSLNENTYDNCNLDALYISTGFSNPGQLWDGQNGFSILNTEAIKKDFPFFRFTQQEKQVTIALH